MSEAYPKVFDSATGQWTSLFQEAVNLETIGGIEVEDLQNEDILVYKTASSAFINEDINTYLNNKNITVKSLDVGETLIVNGQVISGSGSATVTTEQIQDAAAPLFNHSFHSNITATYDDPNDRIVLTGTAPTTTEQIQDAAAPLFTHSDHTNVTATYDDANNKIVLNATVDLNVSTEEIQDAVAPLLDHNFHTNITATYDDANDRILLVGASSGGSGSAAPITSFYDIVRDFGAVSNETDSRAKIQNALNAARDAGGGTVYVPKGIWNLGGGLRIYSNTTFILSKFAYMRKLFAGASMLWNGDNGANYSGYNGQINIIVEGGIWDARATAFPTTPANIFSFAHSKNLTFRDTTFLNVGGFHAIEINSTKNALVQNCRFLGFLDTGNRGFSEAVQVDAAFRATLFGEFGSYDKTICQDVIVDGCYFGPSTTPDVGSGEQLPGWPTAVGSHSADTQDGSVLAERWHIGVKVINNTFENLTEFAVRSDAVWRESQISNNLFLNCSGGVGLGFRTRNLNLSWHGSFNFTINGNIFQQSIDNTRDHIFVRNVDGIVISDNHFRFSGRHGVNLASVTEGLITSNRFEWINQHGILLTATTDCMVTNNLIKNVSNTTNNTYSFIIYTGTPTRCSTIGNRGHRGGAGNTALYGLRIENGTSMRSFGNFFGQASTTAFLNNSTSHSSSTANE